MLWLALSFISNTWLVAGSNCPSTAIYGSCANIGSPGPATCANGIVLVSNGFVSTPYSCYWDSAHPATCLQDSAACTPICSTGGRSLNAGLSTCLGAPACGSTYIYVGGSYFLCQTVSTGGGGSICGSTGCYIPGNCPATTAIGSCLGLSQITCPTRFVWNNGPVNNCVWDPATTKCVASGNTCVPPCLPPGRNPTSACSNGNAGTCLGLTSTSTSSYCAWNGSACVDSLSCYTKPNCPTATTAQGSCSGLSSTICAAGFTWNNGPIDNCFWNVVGFCDESTPPCTPPCIPGGGGRSNGICSSQSTLLTCISTSNTSTKRYCYWTGSSCVEQELCY